MSQDPIRIQKRLGQKNLGLTFFHSPKQVVKETLSIPRLQQKFVHGTDILEGDDENPLMKVLPVLAPAEEGGGVEDPVAALPQLQLSIVRVLPTKAEQDQLDSALLIAVASGKAAEIEDILSEGASASCNAAGSEEPEKAGRNVDLTPLLLAMAASDTKAMALLKQYGGKEPSLEPKAPSLGDAFQRRDLADVIRFFANGVDPNTKLRRGHGVRGSHEGTPLHACCALHMEPGAEALLELLVRLGADITIGDSEGNPPLAHARYFGADNLFKALRSHGAELTGPYYSHGHGYFAITFRR